MIYKYTEFRAMHAHHSRQIHFIFMNFIYRQNKFMNDISQDIQHNCHRNEIFAFPEGLLLVSNRQLFRAGQFISSQL